MTERKPPPTHDELRADIHVQLASWKMLGAKGPQLIPATVLRAGIDCVTQPLPKRYKKRAAKHCYANAAALVSRSHGRLTYVEGLAKRAGGMVVDHAWAIDAQNRVIDPTWDQPEDAVYIGVPIDRATYEDLTLFDGSSSAFQSLFGLRVDFLLKLNPALAEIIDAPATSNLTQPLDAAPSWRDDL